MSDEKFDAQVLEYLAQGLKSRTPSSDLRARLLGQAGGVQRFTPFVDRLMALFDLAENDTRRQLETMDEDKAWMNAFPGIRYRDFAGGPALGGAHAGLVRMPPGTVFPHHTHIGEERVLVLQGEVADDHGNVFRAGDLVISPDGSSHELTAIGDREAIYAAVVKSLTLRDYPGVVV